MEYNISFESASDHSHKTSRLFAPLTLCILDTPKRVNSDNPDVMQQCCITPGSALFAKIELQYIIILKFLPVAP